MVDPIIFILITSLGAVLGIKVTSTQNPVYSGLYLVLLFFLGSGIAFLLGLEFILNTFIHLILSFFLIVFLMRR